MYIQTYSKRKRKTIYLCHWRRRRMTHTDVGWPRMRGVAWLRHQNQYTILLLMFTLLFYRFLRNINTVAFVLSGLLHRSCAVFAHLPVKTVNPSQWLNSLRIVMLVNAVPSLNRKKQFLMVSSFMLFLLQVWMSRWLNFLWYNYIMLYGVLGLIFVICVNDLNFE